MEMNLQQVNNTRELIIPEREVVKASNSNFIEANTTPVSLLHLKNDCTIPVFSKDNECTLAHHQFIEATNCCVNEVFGGQNILSPESRVSHTVKGRVPSAIGKPAKQPFVLGVSGTFNLLPGRGAELGFETFG